MLKNNCFIFEKIAGNPAYPQMITHISYYDIANNKFIIRRPVQPQPLPASAFPDVPYPTDKAIYIIAKCTYGKHLYKAYREGTVYELTAVDIDYECREHGVKLINAVVVKQPIPEIQEAPMFREQYARRKKKMLPKVPEYSYSLRSKKGNMLEYSGNGRRSMPKYSPFMCCARIVSVCSCNPATGAHNYHNDFDFYYGGELALERFNSMALSLGMNMLELPKSFLNATTPNQEHCGTAFTSMDGTELVGLSCIKLWYCDTDEVIERVDDANAFCIFSQVILNGKPVELGVLFFKSKDKAVAYMNRTIAEYRRKYPSLQPSQDYIDLRNVYIEGHTTLRDSSGCSCACVAAFKLTPGMVERSELYYAEQREKSKWELRKGYI